MRIDRHDDAAQTVIDEAAHVLLRPEGAVRANQGTNAPLGRVADHGAKVLVRERFSANKKHIANVVFDRDVDHIARLFPRDRTPVARLEFVHREIAKLAAGIANIGDGELQKSGAAVIKHFAQKAQKGLFRFDHRGGELRCGEVRGIPRHGLFSGGLIVSKHASELIATIRPQVNPGSATTKAASPLAGIAGNHKVGIGPQTEGGELWSGWMCA